MPNVNASGLVHHGDMPVRGREALLTVWVPEREDPAVPDAAEQPTGSAS